MEVRFFAGRARRFLFPIDARDVRLTADDGLHTVVRHRIVKRDRAVHVAVVRHRTRRHSQLLNAAGQGFYLNCAVKQTVVGMKMKMYELAVLHSSVDPSTDYTDSSWQTGNLRNLWMAFIPIL